MLTCPVESLFGKDPDVAEDVVDDKVRYTYIIINRVELAIIICLQRHTVMAPKRVKVSHLYINVAAVFIVEFCQCEAALGTVFLFLEFSEKRKQSVFLSKLNNSEVDSNIRKFSNT